MNRKTEREWIIKLTYQYDINSFDLGDIEKILEYYEINSDFVKNSLISIISNLDKIDSIIKKYIENNNLNTLLTIEKSILRVAINEFIIEKSVPTNVSINEAVENAKKFANDESYKLINGILSAIAKEN